MDLGTGVSSNLIEEIDPLATALRLDPGESYECIFKMKSKDFNRFNDNHADNELTAFKNMKEIEQFGEFSISWIPASSSLDSLSAAASIKPVHFTLNLPSLTLVDIPLKVSIQNEKDLNKLTVY